GALFVVGFFITRKHTGRYTHMAVMAGHAIRSGRTLLEIAEGFLQAESIQQVYVVAGSAKRRIHQLIEWLCRTVDLTITELLINLFSKLLREIGIACGAVDGLGKNA